MAKLTVEIVTAERQVYNETDVDMVVAPGSEGVLGILPSHAPLLTTLQPGALRVKKGGTEQEMAVNGGFLQVKSNRVLILADHAERAEEIDAAVAEEARRQAEQALSDATRNGNAVQAEAARAALKASLAQLQVVRRRRGGHAGAPVDR
ncbi:MAG: F0F1 ATP synthase subunit epsilon [Chloroflexi bacterium]|nr:F0F1 ATP synthase subunit epsilon [Chloroflexota bacterium]